ncbi:transglycosylase [Alicyclobacillus contaminans]|uniref:lytic transglycosylase domain-containing protein n=1 Tax=Alicyclobacillus contaminans TaxID=392016 RepID=UPI00041D6DA7|nr:lytic transglycosylase domain-containing protein [Alicyclobacillus contaminans]GMA51596.1 transglycosylase [Alicyclobacillus contaminans]
MADSPQQHGGRSLTILVFNRRTLISFILLLGVICLITSNTFWRWMYPISYQSIIQSAAHTASVDPLLVASVIHVESKYKSEDVSHAGAIGLMQLMPDTAQWIAVQMQQSGTDLGYGRGSQNQDLAQPELNIRLGSWYIHYLTEQFHGNQVAAVAAYNAGPKRVKQWLASGTWDGQLVSISRIPVGETRHFVDRVFYNYDLYKRIYGADAQWKDRSK